jgi:predicted sulfurtransferase
VADDGFIGSMTSKQQQDEEVIIENSRSVAFCALPAVPEGANDGQHGTILLMYQYKEPAWSKQEHKKALKKIIELGQTHKVAGRGRVAPEGVNFTLSGEPQDVRAFCYSLREWNPIFLETDFKLTDWIPKNKLFKSLSIRKTEELVAYGLTGEKAPSLQKFSGTHLEADEYHQAMTDKDTVIIDVRNAYESSIGSFRPPEGGAELIDPKIRNSIEFPKWLADPATQEKLNGKKVLMYCTGGIRCERASALLNQMSTVNPDLKPKGVYHMRGGIERYVKTFPQGGFWKGKNYLFDRRMEQVPGTKDSNQVE